MPDQPHDTAGDHTAEPSSPFANRLKEALEKQRAAQVPQATVDEDADESTGDRRLATSLASLAGIAAVATAFVVTRQADGPATAVADVVSIAPMDDRVDVTPDPEPAAPAMVETSPAPEVKWTPPTVMTTAVPTDGFSKASAAAADSAVPALDLWSDAFASDDAEAPAPETTLATRRSGLNYFVLLSTPDRVEAERRMEKAHKDGVPCDIQQSLAGFARTGYFSLVTTRGYTFPQDKSAYQGERQRLESLGFQPAGYRWR